MRTYNDTPDFEAFEWRDDRVGDSHTEKTICNCARWNEGLLCSSSCKQCFGHGYPPIPLEELK